jgi:hypothetical protein
MRLTRRAALGALLMAAVAACGNRDEAQSAPAVRVDTTNADALDGLSSQQVEAKAEALTPEQAAARGIAVDSSIHVEASETTAVAPGAPAQPGRTAFPPASTDTSH